MRPVAMDTMSPASLGRWSPATSVSSRSGGRWSKVRSRPQTRRRWDTRVRAGRGWSDGALALREAGRAVGAAEVQRLPAALPPEGLRAQHGRAAERNLAELVRAAPAPGRAG